MNPRTLVLFLGSLLAGSWVLQCAALVVAGDVDSPAMTPWLIANMFQPTLWAAAWLLIWNRQGWRQVQWRPGNPLYLLAGALLPAVTAFAVLAAVAAAGLGHSSFMDFSAAGADVLRGPWVLGRGAQGWLPLAANVAATAVMFALLNGSVAVGEEFGWRGVLQRYVIERHGVTRGVVVLGLVWAFWHLPLNLAGYNYPEAPALGALVLFPLQLVADSFVMAWLTIRARSFWPAVLMHGSANGIQEGVMSSLALEPGVPVLLPDLLGLGFGIALALLAGGLLVRSSDAAAPPVALRRSAAAAAAARS